METEVFRHGDKALQMKIDQGKDAIVLWLRAHAIVEDFFKGQSTKEDLVSAVGNGYWYKVGDPDGKIYRLAGPRGSYTGNGYTLDYPGYFGTNEDLGLPHNCVNLSFLRMKGISEPDGVKLGIKGVMSLSARRELRDSVKTAMGKFVRDYLIPVTLELEIRVDDRIHV